MVMSRITVVGGYPLWQVAWRRLKLCVLLLSLVSGCLHKILLGVHSLHRVSSARDPVHLVSARDTASGAVHGLKDACEGIIIAWEAVRGCIMGD